MNPNTLTDTLDEFSPLWRRDRESTMGKLWDWVKLEKVPSDDLRGGGLADATPNDIATHRAEDRKASKLHAEAQTIEQRMIHDANRLDQIRQLTRPRAPKRIEGKQMLAAQVAAEGWCVSCWRDEQHVSPIELRKTGEPYYKDLCRFCGGWKGEFEELPDMDTLQRHHLGHRITRKAG